MKKGVRLLLLMLVLLLFGAMALGSGSSESDGDEKEIVVDQDNKETKNDNKETEKDNKKETEEKLEVTIQEQVLVDQDGIKITAKSYVEDSIWGEGIKVLVENNGDKSVGISCNALIVNNYMITDLFSCSVAAGKKSNETIYLSSSELKAAGIDNVGQIEIYFHAYDSDSYETLFDTDVVQITTSEYEKMDTAPMDAGTELYNQEGVRIVGKLVDEESFWGTAVLLYLENTSGRNITVSCEDMSINGFMVTPFFYSSIYDGKMAIDEITILSSDLEENEIDSVDEIELVFHIYDTDTYETVVDTDPIVFSTK